MENRSAINVKDIHERIQYIAASKNQGTNNIKELLQYRQQAAKRYLVATIEQQDYIMGIIEYCNEIIKKNLNLW